MYRSSASILSINFCFFKSKAVLSKQPGASGASVAAAESWGDVLLLAVPGAHTDEQVKAQAAILGPGAKVRIVFCGELFEAF